jgi:nucleotide-binding universal stress UspA family protein
MKKRFIILVDFSASSANLLKYAYVWSKEADAELLLLHQTVQSAPTFAERDIKLTINKHLQEEALDKLKELVESLFHPSTPVSYSVSEIPITEMINKHLTEEFENIILLGIKKTSLLKKIFIGSTAIKIIDNINNITVGIPSDIDHYSHEKLFVAVSEQHPFNLLAFNKYLEFVSEGKTSITFFHIAKINQHPQSLEKQLQDLANMYSNRFETAYIIFEGKNSFEDIKQVINNKIDEMLIIQKGSRLLTDQLFRKFVINELVYEGKTPLVILP